VLTVEIVPNGTFGVGTMMLCRVNGVTGGTAMDPVEAVYAPLPTTAIVNPASE